MSGNEDRREQAQKLLRSFTDIDDRFIAEAMEQEEAKESPAETKPTVSGNRRFRRFSTWALTAAACLTVVIIGRYVTLHQNLNMTGEKAVMQDAESEVQPADAEAVSVDEAMEELVNAEQAAEEAPEEAAGQAAEEGTQQVPKDAVEQAAEEAAEEPVEEAAEEVMDYAAPSEPSAKAQDSATNTVMEAASGIEDEEAGEQEEMGDTAADTAVGTSQIANPWIDTDTLEEAEKAAGLKMSIPDAVSPYTAVTYRAIPDQMLEIIYTDREGQEGYRIRKAAGEEDISGDYNEYAKKKTIRLTDGTEVQLQGEGDDCWLTAVWTAEDEKTGTAYSYAVCGTEKTFTTREIRGFAGKMTETPE